MKTAAAYIRVSDERQDEYSPDSQLKLIREYCQRNEILLPDEYIFYDDGISARSVKNRKEFNEMIALAKLKDRPFDLIIVWKFSRFARNQEESVVYKSLLRKNGVEVVSVSEPLSDSPFGGLIERIIEWMDEYYLIRLSDEVRRGMTERAERGLPNAGPPFGYRMVNGRYEVVENEAIFVRKIFEAYVSGRTLPEICEELRALGAKNRYGNYIDGRGVEYILNNPCYIGCLRWNPDGRSASRRVYDNPDDILRRDCHTPVIGEELFERAREIQRIRKKASRRYMREHRSVGVSMLTGLLRCHTCGATLVYSSATKGFQCHRYSSGKCAVSHYVSLERIESLVLDAIDDIAGELQFEIEEKAADRSDDLFDYDKLVNIQRSRLQRAKKAYQEGADSLEEYIETKEEIEKQIEIYAQKKRDSFLRGARRDPLAKTVGDLAELLGNPQVSDELKNIALKTVVEKIVLYRPEGRAEIFFRT